MANITDDKIFWEHKPVLDIVKKFPTTRIPNCLKVSFGAAPEYCKAVIGVTGIGENGHMWSTAAAENYFRDYMGELERAVEPFQKPGGLVGWSIGRKENCSAEVKTLIHEFGAHRLIFLDLIDLPKFLAAYDFREKRKAWAKKGLKLKFTQQQALRALEAIGKVMNLK
jgi:uncharacterized protein YcgL (UPF0745 family)